MEAHTHGLDEGTGTRCEQSGRNHFLPRQYDIFTHGTIALHTQRLVMLAGIHTGITAGSTLATIRIGVTGNHHTWLQPLRHISTHLFDDSPNLMTRDHRHLDHRVLSQIGTEIRPAESDILQTQKHLVGMQLLLRNVYDLHLTQTRNLYCFHSIQTYF